MTTREDRMAQRMRGAQRHQVEDTSFGPLFPVADEPAPAPASMGPPPIPSSTTRSTPNTSAKRVRLSNRLSPNRPAPQRRPTSAGKDDPYVMAGSSADTSANTSNESLESARSTRSATRQRTSDASRSRQPSVTSPPNPDDQNQDEVESPPDPTPHIHEPSEMRVARATPPGSPYEEVTESPADAPGSGRRRKIAEPSSSVAQSTARLQQIAAAQEDELSGIGLDSFVASSPSVQKTRRSTAANRSRVTQTPRSVAADEPDELSPEQDKSVNQTLEVIPESEGEESVQLGEAEEDATMTLLRAGKDVLRRGMAPSSPVLGSVPFNVGDLGDFSPIRGLDEVMEEVVEEAEREAAQEIDDLEAATRLGKKGKTRSSLPSAPQEDGSPILSPPKPRGRRKRQVVQDEAEETSVAHVEEQTKRRGRKKKTSLPEEPEPELEPDEPELELGPEPQSEDELDQVVQEQPTKRGRRRKQATPQIEDATVGSIEEEPAPKRKSGRKRKSDDLEPESPIEPEQESPEARPAKKPRRNKDTSQRPSKPTRKSSSSAAKPKRSRGSVGGGIPITVQRFTKPPLPTIHEDSDASDDDILHAHLPFAARSSVNIMDVLSQVCEELIGSTIDRLGEAGSQSEDRAQRAEMKAKYRALKGYREELRSRMLEHAVALDNYVTVEKRVRAVQKERVVLREEVSRIKKEREEVALRMDVVRAGHERDRRVAMQQIDLSASMHNIELAVEMGKQTDDVTTKEEKKMADLGNLEVTIKRVVEEASSKSRGGGVLGTIREFNAFLERAAVALEGRQ